MRTLISNMPPKRTVAAMALLSFAAAFLVMFFSPFDIYLHNPTGFVVSWKFLLPTLSLITFGVFLGIFAVLSVIWYVSCRIGRGRLAFDVAMLLLLGAMIAMYAQLMFFNGSMVQITGDQADYARLAAPYVVNLLIWIALCFLPLLAWVLLRKKKGEIRYDKLVMAVAAVFIGMQSAGLIAAATRAQLPTGFDAEDGRYLSFEPFTHPGTEENILVFLMDRLDGDYMDETLGTYPELGQELDGFTYYKNNTPQYQVTFPSVCTMLTGHYYQDGQQFGEYWDQAWAGDTFVGKLKKAGFTTNLSLDFISTYHKNSQIENVADNLRKSEGSYASFGGTLKVTARLSLGRMMPYSLKNMFLRQLDASLGNQFYKMMLPEGQEQGNEGISPRGDLAFYQYITRHPVTPEEGTKTFHFIHLNGSHTDFDKTVRSAGYHLDDATGTIEPEGNFVEATRACFKILDTYFDQMKASGVYDNTTIILVGDHGASFTPSARKYRGLTAGLLIKPKNARGALKTDSTTELSNAYFGNSLLELAGVEHEGVSYFDIIEGKTVAPPRRFCKVGDWWAAKDTTEAVALLEVYEITGNARSWANWKLIEGKEKGKDKNKATERDKKRK